VSRKFHSLDLSDHGAIDPDIVEHCDLASGLRFHSMRFPKCLTNCRRCSSSCLVNRTLYKQRQNCEAVGRLNTDQFWSTSRSCLSCVPSWQDRLISEVFIDSSSYCNGPPSLGLSWKRSGRFDRSMASASVNQCHKNGSPGGNTVYDRL
jgi:hypothetical protein